METPVSAKTPISANTPVSANTAASAKTVITPQMVREWTHDAGVLLDANCSAAEVIRDLKSRGCTPRMAEQIVLNATGPVQARHRKAGLRNLLIGIVCLAVGWILLSWSRDPARAVTSIRGMYGAAALLAFGGVSALFGAYKLLTGSAVDSEPLDL